MPACLFVALLLLLTASIDTASGDANYCNKSLPGSISPECQPADCGVYCMREMPDGNADCQAREAYPPTAKCCDHMTCDSSPGGACNGSIIVDAFDPDNDGGQCIYSGSEDTSSFTCPNGWTHIPLGDPWCAAKSSGYQGAFKNSMCCCAPTADTCNGYPPEYEPNYDAGTKGALSLQDTDTPWYATIKVTKYGDVMFETTNLCIASTSGAFGSLGIGEGDCDDVCDIEDDEVCDQGLKCSDDAPGSTDYCCPAGYEKYINNKKKCCSSGPNFAGNGGCSDSSECPEGFKCLDQNSQCVKIDTGVPPSCDDEDCTNPDTVCMDSIQSGPDNYCFFFEADCSACDSTATREGFLRRCMGDCDEEYNDYECDSDECEPGLQCSESEGGDYCCPKGTTWDTQESCCKEGGPTTSAFNIEHDTTSGFNAFVRIVKACNNGTVECGEIKSNGEIDFSADYCEESKFNVESRSTGINYTYIPECAKGGEEDEPRKYTVLMKVDRAYEDKKVAPQYLNLTVAPGVYKIIGINDSDLVRVRKEIADAYEACRTSAQGCIDPATGAAKKTDEGAYDYCIVYTLVRSCDMPFNINITNKCKNVKVEGKNLTATYKDQVDQIIFFECNWDLIDGGKFHDFPGIYIAVANKSRHGANIGLLYYYVNALQPKGITHMVNPGGDAGANIQGLLEWNFKSAGRIMGCRTDANTFWSDKCGPGNFSCSMGAGLAYAYSRGFRASALGNAELSSKCGYFEWEQPETSRVAGQRADYFQFNDLDDEDRLPPGDEDAQWNEYYLDPFHDMDGELEEYDDQAFDYEMGIPDRTSIVNYSISSIETNISALFVKYDSIEWKGMPYRLVWQLHCRPGSCWDKKYYRIPWGKGTGGCTSWSNGPWYGGTTYEYQYQFGYYTYDDYPDLAEWVESDEWAPDEENCNNPIVYWRGEDGDYYRPITYDTPAATDRYWIIHPIELSEEDEDKGVNVMPKDIECTRPAHGGDSEPLYYTNPGGAEEPGDAVRENPFNEGKTDEELIYYRQFNKRMLWANVFKVTPEFHNKPPRDDLCVPPEKERDPGKYGGLGIGQGGCDGDCNPTDDQVCAEGLKCIDAPGTTTEYCCPTGSQVYLDDSHRCCPQNVFTLEGKTCTDNTQCGGGYTCVDQIKQCASYDQAEGTCSWDACDDPDTICMDTIEGGNDNYCIYADTSKCSPCDSNPDENGFLGKCMGDCDSDQLTDQFECDEEDCRPGLHCDGEGWLWGTGFCCPPNTNWDATVGCCMPCGVYDAKLYDGDYCYYKVKSGCKCKEGEGGCSDDSECEAGFKCKDNPYTSVLFCSDCDNACCPEDSRWNGYACLPPSSLYHDATIYTRTGGNSMYGEGGGGPIWFHFAAGGNLPNETEAGGSYDANTWCMDNVGGGLQNCGSWGLLASSEAPGYYVGSAWNYNTFWNNDICTKAWTYMRDQGGIWDEQKNLGFDRIEDSDVEDEIWDQTGEHPNSATFCNVWAKDGYWCTSAEGCNCHPNDAKRKGPGEWANLWAPQSGMNEYWLCDAAMEGTEDIPESCGKACRKMVLKDWYKNTQVEAWFDYVIQEDAATNTKVQMGSGPNVLPLEAPWNFLHAGAMPPIHSLNDKTTMFEIMLQYTAKHPIVRRPLAQSCIWYGCSADQYCAWVDLYDVCEDGSMYVVYMDCGSSPCGPCEYHDGYPKHFIKIGSEGEEIDCWTHYKERDCIRCWGTYWHWGCDYPVSDEDPAGGYHESMPDVLEEINDTSWVEAKPYGSHLETSRPLGNPNSHARVRVTGYVDYKWGDTSDELDYRDFRVNGSLRISSKDSNGGDLLGGFELLVPDSIMVSFVAKDYPAIHELYIMDSTPDRRKIYINRKMQDMLHIQKCDNADTNYNYFHFVINPMKKYYYAAQGKATQEGASRVFFSAIGEFYSWDVTLMCKEGGWFRDPTTEYIGMFRNFHEDEARYWDYVGFYPQRKDLTTAEYSLTGNETTTASETFTSKKTPEEESGIKSKIGYDYNTYEYTFNFSTQSIASETFENSRIRVYSDYRYIELHPFREEMGQSLSCSKDHIVETLGSTYKDIYMRHPVSMSMEKTNEDNETASFKMKVTDQCTGSDVSDGKFYIKFNFPYTNYSGMYDLGQEVTVVKMSKRITFTGEYTGYGGISSAGYQPAEQGFEIQVDYKDLFDYIYENLLVITIAFVALMSYRFFSTKRMDFQEMWDEWKGKK